MRMQTVLAVSVVTVGFVGLGQRVIPHQVHECRWMIGMQTARADKRLRGRWRLDLGRVALRMDSAKVLGREDRGGRRFVFVVDGGLRLWRRPRWSLRIDATRPDWSARARACAGETPRSQKPTHSIIIVYPWSRTSGQVTASLCSQSNRSNIHVWGIKNTMKSSLSLAAKNVTLTGIIVHFRKLALDIRQVDHYRSIIRAHLTQVSIVQPYRLFLREARFRCGQNQSLP